MSETPLPPAPPLPVPDPVTAFFWEALREHTLAIQWCSRCERFQHTPAHYCFGCGTEELTSRTVSGRGRVHSSTTLLDPPGPAFVDRLPLTIVVVELDEQAGLVLAAEMPSGPAPIGTPVEAYFEDVAAGTTLPRFRPLANESDQA